MNTLHRASIVAMLLASVVGVASAQAPQARNNVSTTAPARQGAAPAATTGVTAPADYVIGVDDALDVVIWGEKDMSSTATVRPDGKISLPLLNDIQAAGSTTEQLRARITEAASKYVDSPSVTVVVKTINSRKVFITGQVGKPGPYSLVDSMTVLQLIATAGGVNEYANAEHIQIVRVENGRTVAHLFNYKDVSKGKGLTQNIVLQPGDTVIVP